MKSEIENKSTPIISMGRTSRIDQKIHETINIPLISIKGAVSLIKIITKYINTTLLNPQIVTNNGLKYQQLEI